jgi:hypothetical protein
LYFTQSPHQQHRIPHLRHTHHQHLGACLLALTGSRNP